MNELESDTRPWGGYQCLLEDPDCKVKKIWLKPGKRNSYQRHSKRDEVWVLVSGSMRVILDDTERRVAPGEAVLVPRGTKHRFCGDGDEDAVLIEVQTGDYFGEDDIERFEDDYGREGTKPECVDGRLVR